jgi:hypothetical protein
MSLTGCCCCCAQGEGKNKDIAIKQPRKSGDRIYRYATYNDLGQDIKKTLRTSDLHWEGVASSNSPGES